MQTLEVSPNNIFTWINFCNVNGVGVNVDSVDFKTVNLHYLESLDEQSPHLPNFSPPDLDFNNITIKNQTISNELQKKLVQVFAAAFIGHLEKWREDLYSNVEYQGEEHNLSYKINNSFDYTYKDDFLSKSFKGFVEIIQDMELTIDLKDVLNTVLSESEMDAKEKIFYSMMFINTFDCGSEKKYIDILESNMIDFWSNLNSSSLKEISNNTASVNDLGILRTFIPALVWDNEIVKNLFKEKYEQANEYLQIEMKDRFRYLLEEPFLIKYSEKPKFDLGFEENAKIMKTGELTIKLLDLENYMPPNKVSEFIKFFYSIQPENINLLEIRKNCLINFMEAIIGTDKDIKYKKFDFYKKKGDSEAFLEIRTGDTISSFVKGSLKTETDNEIVIRVDVKRDFNFTLDKVKIKNNLLDLLDVFVTNDIDVFRFLGTKGVFESLMLHQKLEDSVPLAQSNNNVVKSSPKKF